VCKERQSTCSLWLEEWAFASPPADAAEMQLGLCSCAAHGLIAWQMIPLGSRRGNTLLPLSSSVSNLPLPDTSPLKNRA